MLKQSDGPSGILLASPQWEPSASLSLLNENPATYAEHHILLCGLPDITTAQLESLVAKSRCVELQTAQPGNVSEAYARVALACFETTRQILQHKPAGRSLVQLVVAGGDEAQIFAGLSGLLRTVTLENPEILGQIIFVRPDIPVAQLAQCLITECGNPLDRVVQYVADVRLTRRLRLIDEAAVPSESRCAFKEDGVYLITGGLGGLGILLAQEMLRRTSSSKIILSGRSAVAGAKLGLLKSLQGSGRVEYRQADVTNADEVQRLLSAIAKDHGRLNGIVHSAGILLDAFILKKSAAQFSDVLRPKVSGTEHLDLASQDLALDFFVLFSSIASWAGNIGQADYVAANGFMNQFAEYRNKLAAAGQRQGRTLAIAWPHWLDGGMNLDAASMALLRDQTGLRSLETTEGLETLQRCLTLPQDLIVVMKSDAKRTTRPAIAPAPKSSAGKETAVQGDLTEQTREFLKKEFSTVLKIPVHKFETGAALENYGIDSILAMNLTSRLEATFGLLAKTLFFEYQTIDELTSYLLRSHAQTLNRLFATTTADIATAVPAAPPTNSTAVVTQRQRVGGRNRQRFLTTTPANVQPQPAVNEPIAIIGLSGRYPQSRDIDAFWRNLRDGKDCITEVPGERWDWRQYYSEEVTNERAHSSKWGGFIEGVDEFDPRFFNIAPREALMIDPQERLFLQHAWMAIEDAGYTRKSLQVPRANTLAAQVGVYVGVMYGEYNRSGSLASIANRVSYALNLHGPSMTLDTMCSSSLTAIHLACQDLRAGGTDLAIAGGVNLSIHPGKYAMLSAGQFISSAGHCQSFGEGGDGYVPGEGVGALVLKRLSDAERDNDAIYAIIRGSALNHGGKTNGYTVPNPQAQAAVIAQALAQARVHPRHISYIEAHGTGTKLGDPIEVAALGTAFRQHTGDTQFCLLGSAKSNIGHCESAAGIAGLTKVLLQMRHRQIVPSLHSAHLNPHIDFVNSPFEVNQQLRDWRQPVVDGQRLPRIAGLSSFGAGGSNAHFVIEEYNEPVAVALEALNEPVIVPLSAHTPEQLTQKAQDLLAFLRTERAADRPVDIASLAYTLQVGREAMEERLGFITKSVSHLSDALAAYIDGDASGVFRGQVKVHKETLALFSADADFDETLDKWIAHRKLTKLTDLWVKGLELHWRKFYGGQPPKRIHLPTYPFAKEKYWIDPTKLETARRVPERQVIHPLLHENTSDIEQLRYSSRFTGDEPLLGGARTLSAAILLEMASAALRQSKRHEDASGVLELRDWRLGEAFAIDAQQALHIALHPGVDQAIDFDIYSGDADERVHAQGSGALLQSASAGKIDLDAITKRLSEVAPPPRAGHLTRRLWLGPEEMLIAIQGELDGAALLHPALVEAVLDMAATSLELGTVTPLAVDSLHIASGCTSNMRVWVRWHGDSPNRWDMDWCDADGNVLIRWRGLALAGFARNIAEPTPTAQLSKPLAIVLTELDASPAVAGAAMPKPNALQLSLPDTVPSLPESTSREPTPMPQVAKATPSKPSKPPRRRADLQAYLRRSLAQALYLEEAHIDDDRSFVELGLDSIVGVEWIKRINKDLRLNIAATHVYDYATIIALTGYVESLLPKEDETATASSANQDEPMVRHETVVPPHSIPPHGVLPALRRRFRTLPGRADDRVAGAAKERDDRIAIVGMSGRYPGAGNLQQFWCNLRAGKSSVTQIPAERWDVNAYYDPVPGTPGKSYCKWLGALEGAEEFDPLFFQISPSEAQMMDPQHRLFMQESYRAFEDAGYSNTALSNTKCGVYLGIMSSEYAFLLAKADPLQVETTGNSFAIGAARIAYHLNLKGPAIPIDTACSSSLVAIHLACQALLNHEIDMGLAGGVSLYLLPESYVGMCRAGMLSPEGQCKTFDNSANGFVPGEGVGAVVLKRLSDAERDGDSIYGVIIGSGINQDGKTNGITAPSMNSQIELEREIYRKHRIDPASISYVETHGTGTKLGDPIELEALATVFKEHTERRQFCGLGAVKTNIGHTSGAAGVAGLHKVLLCLRNKQLVPNLNITQENALFDFAHSPFYVSTSVRDWNAAPGEKRRAAVSAFGFSGTNAHLVVEEYTPVARPDESGQKTYIVPLSARSSSQLQARAQDLLAFLTQEDPDFSLRDLAYTLQVGREPMRERCAWRVDSIEQLQIQLREFLAGDAKSAPWHRGSVGRGLDSSVWTEELATLRRRDGAQQSASIAALWAEGAQIDWSSFYGEPLPRRLHLPAYPFAKERYWVQSGPAGEQISLAPPTQESAEARQEMFYAPLWQVSSLPARHVPFGREDTLLILDGDERLFEQIKARLQTATSLKAIVLVQLANTYQQHAADHFTVNALEQEHFDSLLEALRTQGQRPTHVIHNCNSARLELDQNDDFDPDRALQFSIDGLFALCKALVSGKSQQSACTFVSFSHAAGAVNAASCMALSGFYQSLALENNRYSGRVLLLDHERIDAEQSAIDTVTCIIDELQAQAPRESSVRYEAFADAPAQRFLRVPTPLHLEQRSLTELPLKHRGVYLIVGGLGGLGYVFSRHLAERYGARLVLSGRSSIDASLQHKIEQLTALGAEVLYVPANIEQADDARHLITSAKARFGHLNGVLHSAGINRDAWLIKKDHVSLRHVLAPKVQGTLHLDRLTANEPLDLFVLFSSVAGSFGNAGQTDYAYANAFMDEFAEHRESSRARGQRFGRTLSIAWPFWQDGGMQLSAADLQRNEQRAGICALPTHIGIASWETLLRSDLTRAIALYGYPSRIAAYCRPPAEPAALTSVHASSIDRDTLRSLARQYLCELVQRETKIPAAQVDIHERFEAFGFDSVMIGRINATLEQDLGEVPKTLFYEYETVAELAEYLCEATPAALHHRLQSGVKQPIAHSSPPEQQSVATNEPAGPPRAEPIAIIGVHAHFPQAEDLHAFWEHLQSGNDLIRQVPDNRWNCADYYDADPAQAEHGKIYCKWGGFLDHFDKFDASFFNIPSAEADIIDPQERLFLQSAWAAVEDAGYTRERLKQQHPKGRSADVGVFVGVTTNSYSLLASQVGQRGQMATPSAMPWSIANRVSYYLDFQGPSMPVDTACSSSLVALHLACESLRRRECQVALAGGVNLYLHPAKYQSFCQRRMLAVGDRCRSYGAGDDGFIPGEGVGTLILKPLHAAERDGDHIYGVVRGSAFDHCGRSNGYATPNPNAQAQVISQALAQGDIPARSISFIEGHGTGTQMGDSLEVAAITQAFGRETTDKRFCALGSVKSNIGHAESATSIAGIAKILLQFQHRAIAPTLHAENPNENIDFARAPCILQTQLTPWQVPAQFPRRALINAFGAGGVNACAVLEEYVQVESAASRREAPRGLFVLCAKDAKRLREYASRYVDYLQRNLHGDLLSLCYTAQTGREAMPERLALLVESRAQLREELQQWIEHRSHNPQSATRLWYGSLDPRSTSKRNTSEQREHMHALCAAQDLPALAQLWTQGSEVDWHRLYAEALPRKLALPTYPFARERHWIAEGVQKSPGAAAAPALSRLHPLISHNSSTLKQVSFDAILTEDQYYARDHKIQGRAVFPGAGFIEMASVAATIAGQQRVRRLKDIVWVQPLALGRGPQHAQVYLSNAIGGGTEFGVVSFDDEHERVAHCEGRLVFDEGGSTQTSAPISILQWQQRCRTQLTGKEYYQRFKRLGFEYGPAFQVIQEVSVGEGCALATLQLAAAQAADFEHYILHPCLIDGALQTVIALVTTGDDATPHLPFAIDEIEILGSLTARCYVLVETVDERSRRANILQFNLHILSESGEPLLRIKNFYVRALLSAETAHAAPGPHLTFGELR